MHASLELSPPAARATKKHEYFQCSRSVDASFAYEIDRQLSACFEPILEMCASTGAFAGTTEEFQLDRQRAAAPFANLAALARALHLGPLRK
jgi:hypothetical protein